MVKYIREPPENAKNMLALAKCDLSIAKIGKITDEIRYQALITLCQQAMEKSLKALLIQNGIEYPKDHSLTNLTKYIEMKGIVLPESIKVSAGSTVLEGGATIPFEIPETISSAVPLSDYAKDRRYSLSDDGEPDEQEYQNVIKRTENIVNWVEKNLETKEKLADEESAIAGGTGND
jgi:HEPN domain-containing protein